MTPEPPYSYIYGNSGLLRLVQYQPAGRGHKTRDAIIDIRRVPNAAALAKKLGVRLAKFDWVEGFSNQTVLDQE